MAYKKMIHPRSIAVGLLALATVGAVLVRADVQPLPGPGERVITITAQRFRYEPAVVTLKKGEPVTLELSSIDVVHGFNLPDFNLRTDVPPGGKRRVRFVPDKAGRFSFHCDNFCGTGHEEMAGVLNVVE